MIKDTFFSFPRFASYMRKDFLESGKSNLLRIGMMFGVAAIILVWQGFTAYESRLWAANSSVDPIGDAPLYTFFWLFWLFGCLAASMTMEKMKRKTSRLSYLMEPVTPFEKYFARWITYTVIYMILFFIIFILADLLRVLILTACYPSIKTIRLADLRELFDDVNFLSRGSHWVFAIVCLYFFTQSCFTLGSSIWPKNSFVKTLVAGVVIALGYSLVIGLAGKALLDGKTVNIGRDLEDSQAACILSCIMIFFTLFNWVLGYFRFKEAEIIERK